MTIYGSVARNDDKKDSDIDILIITSNIDDDLKIRDNIYSKTFDTLLKTGENLSVHFVDKEHYITHLNFPFYMSLEKEGILIG